MTSLEIEALKHVPLTKETVQSFYDGSRSGTAEQCLKALCKSHERLRAELEGAMLVKDDSVVLSSRVFDAMMQALMPFARQATIIDANDANDGNGPEQAFVLFRFRDSYAAISIGDCRLAADAVHLAKTFLEGSK